MMGFIAEEKTRRWQEYVEALEDERRKIQVFERELPLCLQLITEAIRAYKRLPEGEVLQEVSECDEETVSEGPVLEEFLPVKKRSRSSEDGDEEVENINNNNGCDSHRKETAETKPDWLKSVQLWSQQPEEPKHDIKPTKPIAIEAKKATGAFVPFQREHRSSPAPPPPAASSSADTCGGKSKSGGEDATKEGHSNRKARRCWSPELHRRFLHALQQLGGSHVATPKQIRDLMKVDGLTNDEVKSHLQKYRLHNRRPSPPDQQSSSSSTQAPQLVMVSGIWMPTPPPPPEQAAAATPAAAASQPNGNSSGFPSIALQLDSHRHHQRQQRTSSGGGELRRGCCDEDAANSNSPATSCSSLTITTSPNLSYH